MKSVKFHLAQIILLCLGLALLAACSVQVNHPVLAPPVDGRQAGATATPQPVQSSPDVPIDKTPTSGLPPTASKTLPPTSTATPPVRPTMPTATQTGLATATPAQPWAVVAVQAHCRYGPGVAYLHSADLYPGDRGVIDGRNLSGTWLWIQPEGLDRHCWAATSTLKVYGAVDSLRVVESKLPYSDLYGPPENVQTARDGSQVTIAWNPIPFTADDDRGYMLKLTLCENGALSTQTYQTYESSLTVTDETSCGGASGGTLWGVEKHGYTRPVEIPWP